MVVRGNEIVEARLSIFEAPRFFERLRRRAHAGRGHRHRGAHLRHLPGRVPDDGRDRPSSACSGGARPQRAAAAPAACTGASGSRATPSTSTCSTRPTSSATRTRWRWPVTTATSVERGLRAQARRRGHPRAARRAVRPPGQHPGRWLQPGAVARAGSQPCGRCSSRRSTTRWRPSGWWRASRCPTSSGTPTLLALRDADDGYSLDDGRIVTSDGLDLSPARLGERLRGGAARGLQRALTRTGHDGRHHLLGPDRARRRWPATGCIPWRGGARRERRPRARSATTSSAASRLGPSSWSTPRAEALEIDRRLRAAGPCVRSRGSAWPARGLVDGGATGTPVPSLRPGRARAWSRTRASCRRRPEPGRDRGRPARRTCPACWRYPTPRRPRGWRRSSAATTRASRAPRTS